MLATGGSDGFLRLWTFPEMSRTHEIKAHEKEIDDLDFSPDGARIVTISKDRRAFVWDVAKGRKHAEMGWDAPKGIKYLFKRIRWVFSFFSYTGKSNTILSSNSPTIHKMKTV